MLPYAELNQAYRYGEKPTLEVQVSDIDTHIVDLQREVGDLTQRVSQVQGKLDALTPAMDANVASLRADVRLLTGRVSRLAWMGVLLAAGVLLQGMHILKEMKPAD